MSQPLSPDRTQYVVGLLFDLCMDGVVLVEKRTGPSCVIGNWNGVGGKVDPGESPLLAMVREFEEETGVLLPADRWEKFAHFEANDYDLHFFWARGTEAFDVRTMEHETIRYWPVGCFVQLDNLMPNVRWMVPFLQDPDVIKDLGTLRAFR